MGPTPCPAAWPPRWGHPLLCSRPSRRTMKGPRPREVSRARHHSLPRPGSTAVPCASWEQLSYHHNGDAVCILSDGWRGYALG